MKSRHTWIRILFAVYTIMMVWLLLLRRADAGGAVLRYNFHPLETVKRFFWVLENSTEPVLRREAWANLLGNLLLFLPFGVLLPMIWRKMGAFWRFALCALGCILGVELCQLITGLGVCDVDDILLNSLGCFAGWGIWRIGFAIRNRKSQDRTYFASRT